MTLSRFDRAYGALLGLALGDALGFPALFHRTFQFPEKRRDFLWRTNHALARQRVIRLTLPFTHRIAPETLAPFPTDDTEYAVFAAQTILAGGPEPAADTFARAWRERVLPHAGAVLTGFSERAALDNLARGLEPPATGEDNPQHYDDSAACRAVPIGLYCAGDPDRAARLAGLDAQVTNAEDGVFAARAMAAAVAELAAGRDLDAGLARGRAELPAGSWSAHGEAAAQACLRETEGVPDLVLALTTRLINTVYSYGNAAPETLPAAFALVARCAGDLPAAVLAANAIPKSADSLPALVGALCGAWQGNAVVSPAWRDQLETCRGLCLPFTAGVRLSHLAQSLVEAKP
jgi:ADP-ribosylglycohydrolase